MDTNRRCLRSAGRTFSEAELQVVTEVVAAAAAAVVRNSWCGCASGSSGAARRAP